MSRRRSTPEPRHPDLLVERSHLRRQTRTALELAVIALAPMGLVDRLAAVAGLLEAVEELPADAPPMLVLGPRLVVRAKAALEEWAQWQAAHLAPPEA